jgi:hypothetical protein
MRAPDAAQRAALAACALLIRGPKWVPALRCIVKNAAPRPGHETRCFTLSQEEGGVRLANQATIST